jgi:hypothetical protein
MQNRLFHSIPTTGFLMTRVLRPSEDILRSLYPAYLDRDIAEIFSVKRRTVVDWRKFYDIDGVRRPPPLRRKTRYKNSLPIDETFFQTIDSEEKAYFLGLLSADGFVDRNGRVFKINLQARDEHILRDMKEAMKSGHPIKDRQTAGGFSGSGPQKLLAISSIKLVSDLAKYGIAPGKSKTLTFPDLPEDLECHFARGSFDGDGHIRIRPKRLFCFLGTEAFVDGLNGAIHRHTGIRLSKYPTPGVWRLSGYGGSTDVLRWMYNGATVSLNRKRETYEAWLRCPGRS